jgi:hypothetical protein
MFRDEAAINFSWRVQNPSYPVFDLCVFLSWKLVQLLPKVYKKPDRADIPRNSPLVAHQYPQRWSNTTVALCRQDAVGWEE